MLIHELEKYLTEQRSNKHLNVKISSIEEMQRFYSTYGDAAFISFTALDKLGINPQSLHGTPIGIYCYPLKFVLHAFNTGGRVYASLEKYINLFTLSDYTILSKMSEDEFDHYIKQLMLYDNNFSDDIPDLVAESIDMTPGCRLYYVVREYSKLISSTNYRRVANISTSIFRYLGITSIFDDGAGIIHRNEPTQCVVFNIKTIHNVYRCINNL